MKIKLNFLAALAALSIAATGCVSTVGGNKTAGVPFVKDTAERRFERPSDEVFQAVKNVISVNGALLNEAILHSETNQVRTVEGKINQRSVWVRVETIDPRLTGVAVQVRTQGGGTDMDLAYDMLIQIALKLR